MNERSALPGLTKPDVPLSEAVYYFASKRYSRVGADFSARKLVELIRGCQLPATGIDADGSRRQIPPSDFVRCGVPPIGERYWGSSREWLVWANSTYGYSSSYGDAIERDRHVIWRNICVERTILLTLSGESGLAPSASSGKRGRGAPASVMPRVIEEMWCDIASGDFDVVNEKEEAMAARYKASRDTCRRARTAVMQIVKN
jgi:hypothetical protein